MSDLVAVYGTLRNGESNNHWLEDAPGLGVARIDGWDMFDFGPYPYIQPGRGSITVEVYDMEGRGGIEMLDPLEGYPTFYNRCLVNTECGVCWIYFIEGEGPNPSIPSGDWLKR